MGIFTSDNFNAGTPGDNLTVDTAWENHAGNAVYSDAGRARISGTTSTLYSRKDVAPASADYTARATIRALTLITNASAGVSVRTQSGANTAYVGRGQHGTNTWRLERRIAGATTLLGSSSVTFSTNTDYVVELVASGTSLELFADGVSVVAQTDGSITAAGAPGINFLSASGSSNTTGWHLDNFEGEEAGGGGAYTLSADPVSYTLSPQAATLTAGRVLAAAPASYTLTPQDAAFAKGYRLSAEPASYTFSGQPAAVTAARILSAAPASYTFTAGDAALTYTPAGTYTLSAEPAVFTLTGGAANTLVGRVLAAAPASYTLTPQDATLTMAGPANYTLSAEPVSYTLTARSAELATSGGEQLGRSRKSWFAAEREAAERAREDRDAMDVAAILAHLMDGELI